MLAEELLTNLSKITAINSKKILSKYQDAALIFDAAFIFGDVISTLYTSSLSSTPLQFFNLQYSTINQKKSTSHVIYIESK